MFEFIIILICLTIGIFCITYLYWPSIYYFFTSSFGCYHNGKWIDRQLVRERWKKIKSKTKLYAKKYGLQLEEKNLEMDGSVFLGKWNAVACKKILYKKDLIQLDVQWYKAAIRKMDEEKFLDFTLAHELTHLYYDDIKNKRNFSKKIVEQIIFQNLCEVRADIVGRKKIGIDVQLAIDSLIVGKNEKNILKKSKVLHEHPDTYRRIQYLKNFETFNEDCVKTVIEDLIQDYPKTLKKYDASELYQRLCPFFL